MPVLDRPPPPPADSVDPEALIAAARRRRRRRRAALAVVLLALAGSGLALYAAATSRNGKSQAGEASPRASGPTTLRLHLAGFGTAQPTQIDRGPCPQGRTLIAIRSSTGSETGSLLECVLTIEKHDVLGYGVRRIVATALDSYSLPRGTIVTRESHTILFARDQRHTTAIFHGRIVRGTGRYAHAAGTLSGGGHGVDGAADWVVELRLAP